MPYKSLKFDFSNFIPGVTDHAFSMFSENIYVLYRYNALSVTQTNRKSRSNGTQFVPLFQKRKLMKLKYLKNVLTINALNSKWTVDARDTLLERLNESF